MGAEIAGAGEVAEATSAENNAFKEITPEKGITSKEVQEFWDKMDLREEIIKETGWSEKIADAINSREEYDIYRANENRVEAEICDKPCLILNDIDWDLKDICGCTNEQRALNGKAPIGDDGKPINLHHIGQHADSPLAEMTWEEHKGKGNFGKLHDLKKESEVDHHGEFTLERANHWKTRAESLK